jgi:hypothetical protein
LDEHFKTKKLKERKERRRNANTIFLNINKINFIE